MGGDSSHKDFKADSSPLSSLRALKWVQSPLGLGVYASANENFAAAHFTRDSTKVSEDLLKIRPNIAVETILTGLELQAGKTIEAADGIKGEIHHEHRSQKIIDNLNHGAKLKANTEELLDRLSQMWGDVPGELTYYGGKDTTPGLVRLVMQYQTQYPQERILDQSPLDFKTKGRETYKPERENITVRESMVNALSSITSGIMNSDLALREFEMKNPRGIKNKFWKDSATSLLFRNGESVNHDAPISEIGIQGITYDALKMSAGILTSDEIQQIVSREDIDRVLRKDNVRTLFSNLEIDSLYDLYSKQEINGLDILAKVIQKQTLNKFWIEDADNSRKGYFGSAIDRDPKDLSLKTLRLVDTTSANAGTLLNSKIFDDLSEAEQAKYIGNIARVLMSKDFLTDVGVRGRAVEYINLVPFYDYHGAGTSWPKETDDIAKGFRSKGLPGLASQLEKRIINAVNIAGSRYEFFYVDADGKVNFDPHGKRSSLSKIVTEKRVIYGTNIPEADQAWSISSAIRSKQEQGKRIKLTPSPNSWQAKLEEELLKKIPLVELLKTHTDIEKAFPLNYIHQINTEIGREWDEKYNNIWWDKIKKVA